jgi:cytoskeletal protein RodZ
VAESAASPKLPESLERPRSLRDTRTAKLAEEVSGLLPSGDTTPVGETLRAAREMQKLTVEEVESATRIRATYLRALEREDYAAIGGSVYAKGFLRTYATHLKLDPEPLLEAYRDSQGEGQPQVFQGNLRPIEAGFGGFRLRHGPNWLMIGSVTAGIVLVIGLVSLLGGRGDPTPTPVLAVPPTTAPQISSSATTTTRPKPVKGVRVTVAYSSASWSSILVDGARAFEGTPAAGEKRTFEAAKKIEMTLGNAGAVQLIVNGKAQGAPGRPGEVWRGAFTQGPPDRS